MAELTHDEHVRWRLVVERERSAAVTAQFRPSVIVLVDRHQVTCYPRSVRAHEAAA